MSILEPAMKKMVEVGFSYLEPTFITIVMII